MAPQLRGFVARSLKVDIVTSIVVGFAAGFAWKFGFADPKKKAIDNFYKNYDAEKEAKKLEATLAAYEAESA